MSAVIYPRALGGTFAAPPSKSFAHRALFCAAMAGGSVYFDTDAMSDDIRATIGCLTSLGAVFEIGEGCVTVTRRIDTKNIPKGAVLDCHESGSTARFLLPFAALFAKDAVITGKESLIRRPVAPVLRALEENGAVFDGDMLPVRIVQNAKAKGVFVIDASVSSQFVSGLLFALPFCDGAAVKCEGVPVSAPYIDMTVDVLRHYGVKVNETGGVYTSEGTYTEPKDGYTIEGDASGAAFLLAAAKGHDITVTNIGKTSRQGDLVLLDILEKMGDRVTRTDESLTVHGSMKRHGIEADITDTPDLAPVIAVLAAISEGRTVLHGTKRLRVKECDREAAICEMIGALGGRCAAKDGRLIIDGGRLCGGNVRTYGDHRISMAACLAAVYCEKEVVTDNIDCVGKSYPAFVRDYTTLGGHIERRDT